jgi:hypothetical protein
VVVVALIPGPLYSYLIPVYFPFIQGRIHAKLGQDREPVVAGLLQPDWDNGHGTNDRVSGRPAARWPAGSISSRSVMAA